MPGLGDDLHVGIVVLDRRLEGVVALVGHVVGRVVEDPADLALAAQRLGEHVRRLLAHLEEVVGHDRDVVGALLVVRRHVRQEDELHPRARGLAERLGRGHRVERQRQHHVGAGGQRRLDVGALLGGVEAGVGRHHHRDAGAGELVGGAGGDRVHEVGRGVPEQRRLVALVLQPGEVGVGEGDLRRGRGALAARPDGLRPGRPGQRQRGERASDEVPSHGPSPCCHGCSATRR